MTNLGLSSCSDVITCDQNWHHLNSNADLSNDAQIRVIGRMEPCTQMLKKLSGKLGSKISCHYTWMVHAKNYPSQGRFLRRFLNTSKPSRRSITASKTREKEKKERRKKILKISKFWFLRMPESQCNKTWCWWQERQAVVLQTHFRPD